MLKKASIVILFFSFVFALTGCGGRRQLLLLNWGEYINDEMVAAFEDEYNCEVIISLAGSNELFYSKVLSGTTVYDLVVPSDYMVEKMVKKDMLQKVDFSRLENYDPVNNPVLPGVEGIIEDLAPGTGDYVVPYFWGTFGLMYNKEKAGLEEAVKEYGWKTMFEEDKTPAGTKVGMYDVPRYAYATTMFYLGLDPNVESPEMLEASEEVLRQRSFDEWGDDALKKNVSGNKSLDLAFVYTGDFLDMLYTDLSGDEPKTLDELTYDIYIPENTIAFLDSLVITKKARNLDLAYEFIDFFLRPEMSYLNASVVGYCTPSMVAYNNILNPDLEANPDEAEWLSQWKYAMETYYPIETGTDKKYRGTVLNDLSRDYLADINIMVNNIKAS